MKYILILTFAIALVSPPSCARFTLPKNDPIKLKILSYNIHRGQDSKNDDRLEEMAAFIKDCNADIVGLQEVDSVCDRSGQVDQAKMLANLTNMNFTFVRHFPFQGGAYGLALLSKYPIKNVQNHRLPVESELPNRTTAFLTAEIQYSASNTCLVGVAHMDYRSHNSRLKQIRIIDDIYERSLFPGILLGDLNAEPGSEEIVTLMKRFKNTLPDNSYSFPTDNPSKKIDFILVENSVDFKILDTGVAKVNFSDHLPVITTLRYK